MRRQGGHDEAGGNGESGGGLPHDEASWAAWRPTGVVRTERSVRCLTATLMPAGNVMKYQKEILTCGEPVKNFDNLDAVGSRARCRQPRTRAHRDAPASRIGHRVGTREIVSRGICAPGLAPPAAACTSPPRIPGDAAHEPHRLRERTLPAATPGVGEHRGPRLPVRRRRLRGGAPARRPVHRRGARTSTGWTVRCANFACRRR